MQAQGQEMDHFPFTLQISVGLQERRMTRGQAIAIVNLRSDDQIGDAGFVLERDEDDSVSGARVLAAENQSGDFNPSAIIDLLQFFCGDDSASISCGRTSETGCRFRDNPAVA